MRDDERDLKAMFEEAAGSSPSVEGALASVRPRIRRAHQRRVVARGSVGVLGLLVFGGLAARANRNAPGSQKVASTGQVSLTVGPTTTSPAPAGLGTASTSPSVLPSATTVPPREGVAAITSTAPSSTTAGAASVAPVVTLPVNPSATTETPATLPPPASTDSSTTTVIATTTTAAVTSTSSQTATFDAKGGSLTVAYTATAMTVVSITPAPGWVVSEANAQPDEIEVHFEKESDESEIHVRLVNGIPQLGSGDHEPTDS